METFNDSKNRTWKISLNLRSVLGVKEALGVDLLALEAGEPPLLERLAIETLFLAQIIACLLTNQMEEAKVDENDILESFDAKTITAARNAFFKELKYFFTEMGSPFKAEAISKQLEIMAQLDQVTAKMIKKTNVREEVKKRLDLAFRAYGVQFGESEGQSESTPSTSPGRS